MKESFPENWSNFAIEWSTGRVERFLYLNVLKERMVGASELSGKLP